MKVLILIPYFGTWPAWMEYFMASCRTNPGFNWIIFSDAPKPAELPENVRFKACSLPEFNKLASSTLDLEINIDNPYKICDLRPAFGVIFSKYLKDAEFWGYSDLDLVYGNLESFLGPEILENHDLISSRKEYFAGHFAIYRNTKKVNELYTMSPYHKAILQNTSKHFAFDERSNIYGRKLYDLPKNSSLQGGSLTELYWHKLKLKFRRDIQQELHDMNSISCKAENEGDLKVFRKDMVRSDKWYKKQNIKNWQVSWGNGRLYDEASSEEFLHFHFLQSKNQPEFKVKPLGRSFSFSISAKGFSPTK